MKKKVVAWFCDQDGEVTLTSGFVAENKAYVEAHKDCNWRRLYHPDLVAELIIAASELRWRQREYLSDPKGNRSEDKGRLVGVAADRLDAALKSIDDAA